MSIRKKTAAVGRGSEYLPQYKSQKNRLSLLRVVVVTTIVLTAALLVGLLVAGQAHGSETTNAGPPCAVCW